MTDKTPPHSSKRKPRAQLRFVLAPDIAMGPGKAALLEHIRDTGSISAAGRRMEMSYKRTWQMVESMNRCFRSPLVETAKGGAGGGGAQLTPLGEQVLARYRRMEALAAKAVARELAGFHRLLTRRQPSAN